MKRIALAVCLLATLPSFAWSSCPTTLLLTGSQGFGQSQEIDAAEGNLSGAPVYPGMQCVACFSWPAGYFRASGYTGTDWSAGVESQERFELVGPVTATPLAFSARLYVTGSAQTYGEGSAGLGEGSQATEMLSVAGGESVSDVPVVLALEHFAGDSFDIHVHVAAMSITIHPYVAVDLRAAFQFEGVPTGWSIVSCRGVDVPVPARPTTWGAVRALYR
jgi:hypothetical protein